MKENGLENEVIDNLVRDYFGEQYNSEINEPPRVRMMNNLNEEPEGFFLVNRLLQILVNKKIIVENDIQSILSELHTSFRNRGESNGS